MAAAGVVVMMEMIRVVGAITECWVVEAVAVVVLGEQKACVGGYCRRLCRGRERG